MSERLDYEAIVIGGGSGGLAFAKAAASCGAQVLLVERDALGGTCINRGCVPKKLIWDAAWHQAQAEAGAAHGWRKRPNAPDFTALMERVSEKQASLRDAYGDAFDAPNLTLRRAEAGVTGPGEVVIDGETLSARYVVLATGARPQRPPIEGADLAEVSDDVFAWRRLPSSLILMGGGYIGCEFAAIFAAFGVKVTLVETDDRLLDGFDADIAETVRTIFAARGIDLRLGAVPERLERSGDGLRLTLEEGDVLEAERIVAATGRAPNTDIPGGFCDRLDIADSGAFAVDPGLQTSAPGVFALGDCADRLPLTPVATRDGDALARRLCSGAAPELVDLSLVARSAFVMPPVAEIGDLSGVALREGADLVDGALVPGAHWTARTACKTRTEGGRLAAVAALGPTAPEIVGALAAAIAGDPVAATGIHPTFAEEFVGRG
jgi:glutathione reductase (NADPH)